MPGMGWASPETGVGNESPKPAAVTPTSTILSLSVSANT